MTRESWVDWDAEEQAENRRERRHYIRAKTNFWEVVYDPDPDYGYDQGARFPSVDIGATLRHGGWTDGMIFRGPDGKLYKVVLDEMIDLHSQVRYRAGSGNLLRRVRKQAPPGEGLEEYNKRVDRRKKLTLGQANAIRAAYYKAKTPDPQGLKQKLAIKYNVTTKTIGDILSGRTWL